MAAKTVNKCQIELGNRRGTSTRFDTWFDQLVTL